MSRKTASNSSTKPPRRRRNLEFGAPSADDNPSVQTNQPSSTALSTRHIHDHEAPLPSLSTLAARVIARNFKKLTREDNVENTLEWLKALPDSVIPKLFTLLKESYPGLLSHAVISANFLRGNSVNLDDTMGVRKETLSAIGRFTGANLTSLQINDISAPSDKDFAAMILKLPRLETLNLRGCTKVGLLTVDAVTKTCISLRSINLSSTSTTPASLSPLLLARENLEVLKIASIHNFTDTTASRFIQELTADESHRPLRSLRKLKLRHNPISEATFIPLLSRCMETIEGIDVSFTLIKQWHSLPSIIPNVEKLSLTSTLISGAKLVDLVRSTPKLRVLNIGALGVRPQSTTALLTQGNSAMTLNDDALRRLTDVLRDHCPEIESVNLVQNSKLGFDGKYNRALAYFIQTIGRRCKTLNLSSIPYLRSSDLEGFIANGTDDIPCRLRVLYLNKTGIDDNAAPWISGCSMIEILEVAETKLSSEGLFTIIDACNKLRALNLTGCRGVKVGDRRRFFEVWEERNASDALSDE